MYLVIKAIKNSSEDLRCKDAKKAGENCVLQYGLQFSNLVIDYIL
jgi:hypothetical protein